MTRRVAVMVFAVLTTLAVPTASAASPAGTASPDTSTTTPAAPVASPVVSTATAAGSSGDDLAVAVSGFPAGPVQIVLCSSAASGSTGCGVRQATVLTATADGTGAGTLRLAPPPQPCPCVVRATTLDSHLTAEVPFELAGAALVPADPPPAATGANVQIIAVEARRSGSLLRRTAELFGFGGRLTLLVTVRNNGDGPVTPEIGWEVGGAGEQVSTMPVIEPRREATWQQALDIPTLTMGALDVRGAVHVEGVSLPIGTTATRWPLGLFLAAAVLVLAAADGLWQRYRHRPLQPARLAVRATALTALGAALVLGIRTGRHGARTDAETASAQQRLLAEFAGATQPAEAAPAALATPGGGRAGGISVLPGPYSSSHGALPADAAVPAPVPGSVGGVLRIPALDDDEPYEFAFVEGVSTEDLTRGPGHFPGSAVPGQIGNFALSGHRTTYQAPFNGLGRLAAGDSIEIDTVDATFTYRVRESSVVDPTRIDVLYPVPGQPDTAPTEALITLVTCHPEFSDDERLVVVGELARIER